jgi:hypothetical protein
VVKPQLAATLCISAPHTKFVCRTGVQRTPAPFSLLWHHSIPLDTAAAFIIIFNLQPFNLRHNKSIAMPLEAPEADPGGYSTFDELLTAVNESARAQGYAILKRRSSNYGADHQPRRYDLVCDRGG